MNAPEFAISVQRPRVWLLGRGIVRDLTIGTDPRWCVGQLVALHVSPMKGDALAKRFLSHTLRDTDYQGTLPRQVDAESPKDHLVAVARVARAMPDGEGWRLHLDEAHPVEPCPFQGSPLLDLFPIPVQWRQVWAHLQRRAA